MFMYVVTALLQSLCSQQDLKTVWRQPNISWHTLQNSMSTIIELPLLVTSVIFWYCNMLNSCNIIQMRLTKIESFSWKNYLQTKPHPSAEHYTGFILVSIITLQLHILTTIDWVIGMQHFIRQLFGSSNKEVKPFPTILNAPVFRGIARGSLKNFKKKIRKMYKNNTIFAQFLPIFGAFLSFLRAVFWNE